MKTFIQTSSLRTWDTTYTWTMPRWVVTPFDGTEFTGSVTPALYRTPSPLLGEHNEYVLKDILGMTDDRRLQTSRLPGS